MKSFVFLVALAGIIPWIPLLAQDQQYSTVSFVQPGTGTDQPVQVIIVYDNTAHTKDMLADWGYGCYIKGLEKDVMFDTGTKPDIFEKNFKQLGLDATRIDEVFISHEHGDHTGGLWSLLTMNPGIKVVVPHTFSSQFKIRVQQRGVELTTVKDPVEICPYLYSSGVLGSYIPEQALVLNTRKGLVLMTGCSHPGILEMIESVKRTFGKNVYMVFGGFHLLQKSDEEMETIIQRMKDLGVVKCGATHCTGDHQIDMFREAFGENFVEMGAGNVITIGGLDGSTIGWTPGIPTPEDHLYLNFWFIALL